VIRKRSEHGLGHLLNPFDPNTDDRDWITHAYQLLLDQPELLLTNGGPAWLDLPALTRIAITSKDVARAFATYNEGRPWREQIKPFNFILHAHIDPFGYPPRVDPAHFRLIAPFESDPARWLQLPWIDLHTGQQHEVTVNPNDHRPTVVRLKTYRDVLALYQHHPEPKSLDPDGNPCNRRSPPGLLARRPITMLTLSLIGKESNRLDETIAGLIGSLDDTLATYSSTSDNAWTTLVVPTLNDFPNRQLATAAGLDPRTLQRIKSGAIATSHAHNRAVLTLITAQLAAEKLAAWGVAVPQGPLEQIAAYLDHRESYTAAKRCPVCGEPVTRLRATYCSEACKKAAYRIRQGR
jgi:hypothetical protein